MTPADRGHELLSGAGTCAVEAWGPSRTACLVEALEGLVETFADPSGASTPWTLPLAAGPDGADLLADLVEDVIDTIDVLGVVPVRFHLADTEDGGVAGDMEVVPGDQATVTGRVPKGVSHHDLSLARQGGGWRCRLVLDL
jgi:SHS2 domain-containing protein